LGSSRKWGKIRSFLRSWITRPPHLDPNARYPPRASLYALVSIGIILLQWFYFYVQVPYDTIPNKPVFLLSLVVWSLPPVIVEWAYRNAPSKREINAYANMMIGIGLLGIVLGISVRRLDVLVPIVAAGLPGLLAGALIGSDSTLLWRLYKDRHARNSEKSPTAVPAISRTSQPSLPRDPEQTQLNHNNHTGTYFRGRG
jgi:hypothetical protein